MAAGARVADLARLVGGDVRGDGDLVIDGVNDLRLAGPSQLGFVRDKKALALARESGAGALLVFEPLEGHAATQIVVADVSLAFARIASRFFPVRRATESDVHPTAVVDPSAELAEPVEIGPHVVVGARTRIGPGAVLLAGVVVGADCDVGEGCVLHPRAVLYDRVRLGRNVMIHAGSVLGSDGFGYAPDLGPDAERRWQKVPQVGTVEVGDDVEIGANCAIDCGTMGATRIGSGVKIDNLVHIAHNCSIGADSAIAAFCALAGSTTLGERVTLGGHVVSAGHLRVVDDVRVGGNSVLLTSVDEPGDYMGYPLQNRTRWARTLHVFGDLPEIRRRIRDLERDQGES
ncbi:MAG: UDP-3-O-(3-hydroxymyristoyl)glucosamine N-acyltransferase [Planctomycetes bacterium]|nr:UDP-3-O-(3-hydroxymyristoyl)glucosamine N-acyltransferase [Planctomycetota bacterium]